MHDILITNAVTLDDRGMETPCEILVVGGRVRRFSSGDFDDSPLHGRFTRFDARGWSLWPGVIDPHVHGRYPPGRGAESPSSLQESAFAGGVTFPGLLPDTDPPITTEATLLRVEQRMEEIHFPCMIHVGAVERNLSSLRRLARFKPVRAFAVYRSKMQGKLLVDDDETFRKILAIASDENITVIVHSEHHGMLEQEGQAHRESHRACTAACHGIMRSPKAEYFGVKRDLLLYRSGGYTCRIVFAGLSLLRSLSLVREAKYDGLPVYAEVAPHHLFLNDKLVSREDGTRFVTNPPLRSPDSRALLHHGLMTGLIDYVGSDHSPHPPRQKARPYGLAPSGFPGLETLLPALLDQRANGALTPSAIRMLTSGNAASIYGLSDRGSVAFNKRADFVFVDHHASWIPRRSEMHSRAKDTAFDGIPLCGARIMATMCGGKFVYERGSEEG